MVSANGSNLLSEFSVWILEARYAGYEYQIRAASMVPLKHFVQSSRVKNAEMSLTAANIASMPATVIGFLLRTVQICCVYAIPVDATRKVFVIREKAFPNRKAHA